MEVPARKSPKARGGRSSSIGDRRDRVANRSAVLGPVHADQRGQLPLRGLHILRGDSEQRIL